ncbi:ThiF family adenylyltransferase (plasmid) [Alkalihalophilus sp. As8PL]|uniref:ThiF family adenylyltransferase n=1 Tax=Alkalihalophilus sp. As8PL TaxID=3237103 RepID=A0AB39BMY2_9BACI
MNKVINLFKEIKYDTNYFVAKRKLYFQIIQVGVGGTGSTLVQQLTQLLAASDVYCSYLLADPDVFEEKNLKNQLCCEYDVGKSKAKVLAERYGSVYDLNISYYDKSYIEDTSVLKMFLESIDEAAAHRNDVVRIPILIGCVDNNYTRQIMHEYFIESNRLIYIDAGNESVQMAEGPIEKWSFDEKENYNQSGYTGQVVCGVRLNNETYVAPVGEVFANILEEKDEIAPSEMSCAEMSASDPQRMITNKFSALCLMTFLNELIACGELSSHYILFHARKGYMRQFAIM